MQSLSPNSSSLEFIASVPSSTTEPCLKTPTEHLIRNKNTSYGFPYIYSAQYASNLQEVNTVLRDFPNSFDSSVVSGVSRIGVLYSSLPIHSFNYESGSNYAIMLKTRQVGQNWYSLEIDKINSFVENIMDWWYDHQWRKLIGNMKYIIEEDSILIMHLYVHNTIDNKFIPRKTNYYLNHAINQEETNELMSSFIEYMKTLAKKEGKNKIILEEFCLYGELFEKYFAKEGFILKKMDYGMTEEMTQAELLLHDDYCVK